MVEKGKGKGKGPPCPPPLLDRHVGRPEPTKQAITPAVPMRPLRWRRLQQGIHLESGRTIWDHVKEMPTCLYEDRIVALFCKAMPDSKRSGNPPPTPRGFGGSGSGSQAMTELQIIDGAILRCGREIALEKLPPADAIGAIVRDLDEEALIRLSSSTATAAELIQLLRDNFSPTAEQLQRLEQLRQTYPDLPLGNIEEHMWSVSRVPAYRERLMCWLFTHSWEEEVRIIRSNIEQFQAVVRSFRTSLALPQFLSIILSVGNYLNAGRAEGRGDGFSLEVLKPGGLDAMRDNHSKEDLRHFIMSMYMEQFRTGAALLLSDLRPALKNVKRHLESTDGGGLKLRKQVKITLENTVDVAFTRIQDEYVENRAMLQTVLAEEGSFEGPLVSFQEKFHAIGDRIAELQSLRADAAASYKDLMIWLHHSEREPSVDFFLLWDDLLIPKERFEISGPAKVKSMLKPIFCDESGVIDIYGLGRLWEVEVGGLTTAIRSGSACSRSRSSSAITARGRSTRDTFPRNLRPDESPCGGMHRAHTEIGLTTPRARLRPVCPSMPPAEESCSGARKRNDMKAVSTRLTPRQSLTSKHPAVVPSVPAQRNARCEPAAPFVQVPVSCTVEPPTPFAQVVTGRPTHSGTNSTPQARPLVPEVQIRPGPSRPEREKHLEPTSEKLGRSNHSVAWGSLQEVGPSQRRLSSCTTSLGERQAMTSDSAKSFATLGGGDADSGDRGQENEIPLLPPPRHRPGQRRVTIGTASYSGSSKSLVDDGLSSDSCQNNDAVASSASALLPPKPTSLPPRRAVVVPRRSVRSEC